MVISILSTLLFFTVSTLAANTDRSFNLINESGRRIELHWVHPQTNEMVLMSNPDILAGATFPLSSFVGHSFQIRELPGKHTGVCQGEDEVCRIASFTVNKNSDQVVVVKEGIVVDHTDSHKIAQQSASNLLSDCKESASKQLLNGGENAEDILDNLADCVKSGIAKQIESANEEITFQAHVRKNMAGLLENYTCADEGLNTTEPRDEYEWEGREVKVMIDRPASKIHVVENFITEEECMAVEAAAEPLLHDATVADGSGGSQLSDSRKAKQAGIKVHWEKEADGDLIAALSRRVYNYVNHVLPFNIQHNGQEDLMSIQYFGRGPDDEKPDRYTPHCDGDCNGLDFKPGNRMATMVMYCKIPEVGGATNFRNSGVHVKPTKYAAAFFGYIDPVTMKMDDGFTEHSGCPVIEGEKKIVTQWVRLGVDDENPWNSFNTLGVKYSDAANQ